MRMGAYSDTGRVRKINEDSFFSYRNENLMGAMVADGMGGHAKGEVASKMATMIIKDHIIRKFDPQMDYVELGEMIRRAFIEANAEIYEYSRHKENSEGMGTTASMAFIYKGKLIVYSLGNFTFSRYTLTAGMLKTNISDEGEFTNTFYPLMHKDNFTYINSGENGEAQFAELKSLLLNSDISDDYIVTEGVKKEKEDE